MRKKNLFNEIKDTLKSETSESVEVKDESKEEWLAWQRKVIREESKDS